MCAIESPYRARLVRMTLEDNPRMAAIGCITGDYDPETPISILIETLAMLRRETLAFLEDLPAMARARTGIHAELGPVTLRDQVESLSAHDEEHIGHIAKLLER
jgi:DinB superfamily